MYVYSSGPFLHKIPLCKMWSRNESRFKDFLQVQCPVIDATGNFVHC